jgi:hypothetical protein
VSADSYRVKCHGRRGVAGIAASGAQRTIRAGVERRGLIIY